MKHLLLAFLMIGCSGGKVSIELPSIGADGGQGPDIVIDDVLTAVYVANDDGTATVAFECPENFNLSTGKLGKDVECDEGTVFGQAHLSAPAVEFVKATKQAIRLCVGR